MLFKQEEEEEEIKEENEREDEGEMRRDGLTREEEDLRTVPASFNILGWREEGRQEEGK